MKHPPREVKVAYLDWQQIIIKETDLPASAKLIAVCLAMYMNRGKDVAWPSLATIQGNTSLSRATVCKYLDLLDSEGWISRQRGGPITGSTTYTITYPESLEEQFKGLGSSTPERLGSTRDGLGSPPSKPELNNINTQEKLEDISTNVEMGPSTHSEKKNGKRVAIPYQDILGAWNRICSTKLNGRADKLMPSRRTAIRKIWTEDEDMRDVESWENYFEHCASDPFMRGKKNGKHHEGWLADIDYVIRYKTFIKEVERQPQ